MKTLAEERKIHRRIFRETMGDGPHDCWFCGESVARVGSEVPRREQLVIHHADFDWTNNSLSNLKPAHHSCHMSYHRREWWASKSPEERKAVNKARGMATATSAYMATLSVEEKQERGRRVGASRSAWLGKTPEERSRIVSERGKKRWAKRRKTAA